MEIPKTRGPGTVLILALATAVAGCDDGAVDLVEGSEVAIAFRAAGGAASAASGAAARPARPGTAAQAGTLQLDEVLLVVDEFKLEGNQAACEGEAPEPDCAKFEAEPHLLPVPLVEGESETVIQETAPPGTFTSLKFETKAVSGNADVQAAIEARGITDWPDDASLLVTGTFTPDGAPEGELFRVFFDAEVKVVLPLPDPLITTEGAAGGQTVFVMVEPDLWFLDETGADLDLRALDWDDTGAVHELEVKLEDGFTKIELGG